MPSTLLLEADVSEVMDFIMTKSKLTTVGLAKDLNYSQSGISRMKTGEVKLKFTDFLKLDPMLNPSVRPILENCFFSEITNHRIPSMANLTKLNADPLGFTSREHQEINQFVESIEGALDELMTIPEQVNDHRDLINLYVQLYDVVKYGYSALNILRATYEKVDWDQISYDRDIKLNKQPVKAI